MKTRRYRGTTANLARLAAALRRGELVAVPTETVYGLAAHALDARACRAIFQAKGRPAHDPLIVHLASIDQVETVALFPDAARRLAEAFWPGPLTLVLPKKPIVPGVVTSGRDSVAVRVPRHPLFQKLLRACGLPLAAPSANPFGYISPTSADHVLAGLEGKIPHLLDGGPCEIGVESTIVDLRDPRRPRLLRPGALTAAELTRVLGRPVRRAAAATTSIRKRPAAPAAVAPGLLARHYSPRTPLTLHPRLTPAWLRRAPADEAFLFFRKPAGLRPEEAARSRWLTTSGDPLEAARALFSTLRELDRAGFRRLHAETAPKPGIGLAINDRLRRAAARD